MTDKFIVIKNGLILTLDRKKQTGYYNLIIKNGKIFLIDYERKFNEKEFISKNPEAKIIDASGKLITPGFFNSRLISSYALCGLFFKNCSYENINGWLSLRLVDKYLNDLSNRDVYREILKITFQRSLLNGEIFVNEIATNPGRDFAAELSSDTEWIRQYFNFVVYSPEAVSGISKQNISAGYKADENINNYSLTSLKKTLSPSSPKLFIESSLSSKTIDSIRRIFGKRFINVLADMELIGPNTIINNPLETGKSETEILLKKDSVICICSQDYVNLFEGKINIDELMNSGVRIITGTGFTGTNILSELKTLAGMLPMKNYSYEQLLQTAILNPSVVFGISNLTGSIEKNKSCDLLMFDVGDLRTMIGIPDPTSELVCEFIIRNLSVTNISSVLLKGEILVENGKSRIEYAGEPVRSAKEISQKLYEAGKLQEFREKYLMRGRVDRILIGASPQESPEPAIFVDMTETEEYLGEGEFTIIGAKEEEFDRSRNTGTDEEIVRINLKEIKSLETELNLFDEKEFEQSSEPKFVRADFREKKIPKKTVSQKKETGELNIFDKQSEAEENPVEKAEIKKSNLKFGFGDSE